MCVCVCVCVCVCGVCVCVCNESFALAEVGCLLCMQSLSTQQQLSADASASDNISSYAASETGDHVASASRVQGIVNCQLPAGRVSSVATQPNVTPLQPPAATADVCAQQTGWH